MITINHNSNNKKKQQHAAKENATTKAQPQNDLAKNNVTKKYDQTRRGQNKRRKQIKMLTLDNFFLNLTISEIILKKLIIKKDKKLGVNHGNI